MRDKCGDAVPRRSTLALDGMATHSHSFPEWPFADSVSTSAFMCEHVFSADALISYVTHDHDGDWQFLCNGFHREALPVLVCLGCVAERDRSIFEVADLPVGWAAERHTPAGAWVREEMPLEEGGSAV